MERSVGLLLVLIATLAITHLIQAQSQQGFISLDCGLPASELSPYNEPETGLQFSSDATFIQSGTTGKIQANRESEFLKPSWTLRYFPEGRRNCYNLNVEKGRNHLIRARFVYGNYDGRNIGPKFDMYLGPNLWVTIDMEMLVNGTREEILHIPTSNSLQICLVKTGDTTPMISTLEIRPMGNSSYVRESGSLKLYFRNYLRESESYIRYPDDVYDRQWDPYFWKAWTQISTTSDVENSNHYEPPKDALVTAAIPTNASEPLTIEWTNSDNPNDQYYLYAHLAEIQELQANDTREFNILLNRQDYAAPLNLVSYNGKFRATTVQRGSPRICDGGECNFQLTRTNKSTLPPLLNAYEVYTVIQFPQSETDQNDVIAMQNIAASYGLSRINWQGDPCFPQQLRWDALNCSNTDMSRPPRITILNLSSSGLDGTIAAAIQGLTQLERLDLSNNNLTGEVPEFLGSMKSLSVINLSGNNLNGSIPQALQNKGLELSVEGNPRLCVSDSCRKPPKKKFPLAIVASVASAAMGMAVLFLFLVLRKKKSTIVEGLHLPRRTSSMSVTFANKKSKRFTYSEVIQMKNNFQRVLGKGGFGMVYHGTVNGSEQVAVKVLTQSSTQGEKQFKAEVDLLLRVHHTNLVSLVGYCYEGDHLALIYEFLPNGDLKQHLSGDELDEADEAETGKKIEESDDFQKAWTPISTTSDVDNSNGYDLPKAALASAAIPTNASEPLTIKWTNSDKPDDQYYLYIHFAEIQNLRTNETREFNMVWNGEVMLSDPVIPMKLRTHTFYTTSPRTCDEGKCSFQLIRTNRSKIPPLLNAIDVYTVIYFPQSETNENDVVAINGIKDAYELNRINWQGDPCVPQHLMWEGLNCSNTDIATPPRITSLNLSSTALTGTIAAAIQNLTQLEKLDLSNNNLTGELPDFLGNMESLLFINLSGNNLSGLIPQALQKKRLELIVEGNPRLCLSDSCKKSHKKKVLVPIVAAVASAAIVIAVLVVFLVHKKKKSTILQGLQLPRRTTTGEVTFANKNSRRFTYLEVSQMTNNFQRVLGKGGFGMVYHGTVNGSEQVAVKVLSQSSTQGYKEFKAEVDLLLRVHHTNLVSLVGYCFEGDHLALIYEFLPNGDLKQHLSAGKGGKSIINWSIRLRVALEAAQGLEYLHIGCKPPMVHRDVKTANILLDENFNAKLADFGLSRAFQGGGESQHSTVIAGTPGYLDPEYNHTGRLGEKSDVYSFGIVLLEMITNQPVINQTSENSHITKWVGIQINRGDILEIMDPNLHKDYEINSVWRALELAMSCANPSSSERPSMSQVIHELKECIVCENSGISNNRGLETQEMNVSLDTTVVPLAR